MNTPQKVKFLNISFVFLFLTICHSQLKGQNPEDYNKIYTKTFLETSQKDFPKALKIADSLFVISTTPRYQAKSLMLSATLLQQSGEINSAVEFATRAEDILKDTEEFVWKAKISGFLATQYRHLKLTGQSKKYIDETLLQIKNISDPKIVNQTMGFVMQEKAYYEIEIQDYNNSILSVNSSIRYFDLSGQNNPFFIANNEQLLGLNYFKLKDYSRSLKFYNSALLKLDNMPDNFVKGLVYNGLAQVYISKNDAAEAKKYIEKASRIAEQSNFLSLKREIYSTSEQYYALTKDAVKLHHSLINHDSIEKKIEDSSSKFINDSYLSLKKDNEEIKKQNSDKDLTVLVLVCLLVGVAAVVILLLRGRKNAAAFNSEINFTVDTKQREIVNQLPESKLDEVIKIDEDTEQVLVSYSRTIMTPLTEQKILQRLEKFEQSTLFLKNTISLPFLASYCSTNTKYLSRVVNSNKKKDFTNYINGLRINYILEKLNEDVNYQKYKISTLAGEAGFSSQSKFAAAFRKITNMSPSEYIQELRK